MRTDTFKNEAKKCRRQAATAFVGKPEEPFLLRLADLFEELAREPLRRPSGVRGANAQQRDGIARIPLRDENSRGTNS